jgi:hypothetical protein
MGEKFKKTIEVPLEESLINVLISKTMERSLDSYTRRTFRRIEGPVCKAACLWT